MIRYWTKSSEGGNDSGSLEGRGQNGHKPWCISTILTENKDGAAVVAVLGAPPN